MSAYEYSDRNTLFEGYLAINQNQKTKRPCVALLHESLSWLKYLKIDMVLIE